MHRTILSRFIIIVVGIIFLTQLESCRHDPIIPFSQNPPITTPSTQTTQDGPTLYANNCASCHGPLATSAKRGTSATLIQTGISTVNNMKSLSFLSIAQIQAIAVSLHDTSSTTTTPTSLDGTVLYNTICASCHGPLSSSTKLGASATLIQTGISSIPNMQSLSYLSSVQIQAIAAILQTTTPNPTPSTNGATLYASYCSSCHGSLASSTKLGATATQIQTGISTISNMSSLSTLTSAQIQAIAGILQSTTPNPTPSTDGATLYASYCASCHGPLASSAKIGASVSRIQTAISSVSNMSSLSTLTSTQIQAISTALTSQPMPTDGPSLYAINCSSCHGPLASSRVGGASVSEIQGAIQEKSKMKYLSTLTVAQLQAISGALAGVAGGDH
jgi:mono/diheme cytochrome c family protein